MWGRLPGPARGPQPHHRGASHSPPSPGTLCPPRPWAQLRNVGAPHSGGTHEALSGAGVAASRTCLRHSHCPPFPSPAGGRARHGRDEMGWAVPACRLRPFCSGAALPVPPRPGRGGQGPVPRVLTLWVSNGGGTNLGLSRTSCSSTEVSWSRQSQAAKGGQTQPLGSISSSCSHPQPRIDPHTHSREIG